MNTHIEVQDAQVRAAFAKMIAAGSNPRPYLTAIGGALTGSTQLRFRDSRAPDGSTWAPLSPVTIALRRKGGGGAKPLLDTGRTAASISYNVGNNDVVVGTNVIQAKVLHYGASKGAFGKTKRGAPIPWGNIPGRAYLGVSADDRTEVLDILRLHLVPN